MALKHLSNNNNNSLFNHVIVEEPSARSKYERA